MSYEVINTFKENEDGGTVYNVGESYPKGSFKPTKKRIEELSEVHPKYKWSFIKFVEIEENEREAKKEESKAEEDEKAEVEAETESEAEVKTEGEFETAHSKKKAKADGK